MFSESNSMQTRRDALTKILTAGIGTTIAAGGLPAFGAIPDDRPKGSDSVRGANEPAWARGIEGQRKPDLGNGFYLNPIIPGNASDPDVVKDGEDYYMVFSTFDQYPGLPIYHSRDLVNWTKLGSAVPDSVGSILAPSIVKHDGRFFIYFPGGRPAPEGKGRGTYVVHATDINGPWSEPSLVYAGPGIDPGHVVGEDGKRYLLLSGVTRVRLSDDGLRAEGDAEKVYDGWHYPSDWYDEGFSLESPKLFRRGDYFYLICAEGGSYGPPTSHMITVARARSVNGPWENAPRNPLLRTRSVTEPWWSRGHGVFVQGPQGDWWVIYHAYENGYRTLGRQTLMEPVEWTQDGWPRVAPRDLNRPILSPRGGRNIGSGQSLSDDFTANRIGTTWQFAQAGPHERARISYGSDGLTLTAKGSSVADCAPLTCIPVDRAYQVTLEAELIGEAEAGLVLFISPLLYAGIGHDGMRTKVYVKGAPARGQLEPTPRRKLWLRMLNDRQVVTMFTSDDGTIWKRHPLRLEVDGYNQNSAPGGGESLRAGIYATGTGKVRLRQFRYQALA